MNEEEMRKVAEQVYKEHKEREAFIKPKDRYFKCEECRFRVVSPVFPKRNVHGHVCNFVEEMA